MSSARIQEITRRLGRFAGRIALLGVFAAGVVVLMLYLSGKFERKVSESPSAERAGPATIDGQIVPVQYQSEKLFESAVGSIRAVHETSIGSKLLARVVEVNVKAGQSVQLGDVLFRLDDSDLKARLQQATAALNSAQANLNQAVADERRNAPLARDRVVSQQEFERLVTIRKAAEAEVDRVRESVKEVQTTLDSATIRAPMSGVIVDKKVDLGDMVSPGQVLVTLFNPKRMQLVANVRESLASQLKVGDEIGVCVDKLNKQCSGTISEIVPQSESASRAFQVKVTGPCPDGIYSGMFGRIQIPLADERVLTIPRQAVHQVGQLELVDRLDNGNVIRRAVRIGRTLDGDRVEVLAGLREGDQVVVPGAARDGQGGPS